MPTKGRFPATKMYEEAITSAVRYYDNQHVYPYTYLGGYCYRNKLYKQALKYWARAASVIRKQVFTIGVYLNPWDRETLWYRFIAKHLHLVNPGFYTEARQTRAFMYSEQVPMSS